MEKEFVSYQIALALKELGFNEPCFTYYYDISGELRKNISVDIHNGWTYFPNIKLITLAPTFSHAFRWFRNKYDIDFSINTTYSRYNENTIKKYSGVINNKTVYINVGFYETYEEAEFAGLQKMIKIIEKE